MSEFAVKKGSMWADGVQIAHVAQRVGTPVYVYSHAAITRGIRELQRALGGVAHVICYSVKANSNLAILRLVHAQGCGFDVVSAGEFARLAVAGCNSTPIVFSGVGKRRAELEIAVRTQALLMVNVESAEELEMLDAVGRSLGTAAKFALRVNPEVDAHTHRHVTTAIGKSKFGIPMDEARELYRASRRMRGVTSVGLAFHIGSQITHLAPVRSAVRKGAAMFRALVAEGFPLRYLDVGGGLGVTYRDEKPPKFAEWIRAIVGETSELKATLVLEPGRALVANAGVLVTQVLGSKRAPKRHIVVVDAGMNDFLRPALYDAYHDIRAVRRRRGRAHEVDVVGPVCESSDVLGVGRRLGPVKPGDLLAVMGAGAYGMTMASNYNSRPRPAEVLVHNGEFRVVRVRETVDDLYAGETP